MLGQGHSFPSLKEHLPGVELNLERADMDVEPVCLQAFPQALPHPAPPCGAASFSLITVPSILSSVLAFL